MNMIDGQYFYEKADQLLRLVKHIRGRGIEFEDLCRELETLANEFMRKAIDLERNAGMESEGES